MEDQSPQTPPDADNLSVANDIIRLHDTRDRSRSRNVERGGRTMNDLPITVGKAPEPARPRLTLLGANGDPLEPITGFVDPLGETVSSLTWPQYCDWRKTKCRPFDYSNAEMATNVPDTEIARNTPERLRALEEIDQATLEFIGEVAELGELFMENGPNVFFDHRAKLIDEAGDIFFCGMWVLDAWGNNPFVGTDDLEMLRVTDNDGLASFAQVMAGNPAKAVLGNAKFVTMLGGLVFNLLIATQTYAGMLANSFKKLKYQRRAQPVDRQVQRVATTLFHVNQILVLANSCVEEALTVNQRKLDARYPDGYQSGQGGGIRTGEGK